MEQQNQRKDQKTIRNSSKLKVSLERAVTYIACAAIISVWCTVAWANPAANDNLKSRAYAGDVKSQIELGLAHLRVEGSLDDRKIGLGWIMVAASSGNKFAVDLRKRASTRFRRETLAGAEKVAFKIVRIIDDRKSRFKGGARAKSVDIVHLAAVGSAASVKALIKDGADLNVTTRSRVSPVSAAFRAKRYDLAKLLLSAGAAADATGPSGRSLLLEAVARNDVPAVALLTSHGASVFTPDEYGTPIFQSERASMKVRAHLKVESRDATRDEVREIQARLKAAGYKPGPVDGVIGRKTWSAFDAFAQDNGFNLRGTGDID